MKKNLNNILECFGKYSVELCTVLLFASFVYIQIWNPYNPIIFSDGFGYYAYLPAYFIYHDWNFDFITYYTNQYYPGSEIFDFRFIVDGETVNRHFAGVSILQVPFFIIAHLLALAGLSEPDGYSFMYQYAVSVAAIFYCFLGLTSLKHIMANLGFNEVISSICLALILFGTNLFHYCISEPSMSHVYSFSLISIFLYLILKCSQENITIKTVFILGLVVGMIAVTRPVNLLVLLLIPFVLAHTTDLVRFYNSLLSAKRLIAGTLAVLIPVIIQSYLWYLQTGSWWVYSYGEFGFNWDDPQFYAVLFSFRKGLFIYTPILLLVLPGIYYFFKRSIVSGLSASIFIFLFVYIVSSWEVWHYGMSFGMRPVVDVYGMACILLAGTFSLFKKQIVLITIVVISFLFLMLNQIQDFQYRHYILHWSDMTYDSYKKVFLRSSKPYKAMLWVQEPEAQLLDRAQFTYDFESPSRYWNKFSDTRYDHKARSGQLLTFANSHTPYSVTFIKELKNFPQLDSLEVLVSTWIKGINNKNAELILEINSVSSPPFYNAYGISPSADSDSHGWTEITYILTLPSRLTKSDVVKFYLKNTGENIVLMDDVMLTFRKRNP